MKQQNNILEEVERRDGMTVPEGYFAEFTERMMAALPELQKEVPDPKQKNTVWLRIRPYAYLAAMFAGIYCMMQLFSMLRNPSADLNIDNFPALTATLSNDNYDMVIEMDDYDILDDMYNQGYSANDLYFSEDSVIPASFNN